MRGAISNDRPYRDTFVLEFLTSSRSALALSFPSEVTFKEFLRPALALLAEHYRLRPGSRIRDVAVGMKSLQRIPIARLPRSPITRRCQPQQCQNHLINFVGIVFHAREPRYDRTLVVFRRETPLSLRTWLNANPIIDRRPDALPRSKVLLRRLNRDMAEQKLDLIQLTPHTPTEPCAGSSQIVRRKCRDSNSRSGRPDHVPYGLFADAIPEHSTGTADPTKDLPPIDGS